MKASVKVFIIILLILWLLIPIFWGMNWRKRALTMESNYKALSVAHKEQGDGFAMVQKLTNSQFDERVSVLVDSIKGLTNENIKLRHVNSLTQIQIKKSRNNIPIPLIDTITIGDTIRIGRNVVLLDSCLKVKAFIPDTGNVVYFSTNLNIKADLLIYEGKRRKQIKLLGLNLFRVGSRTESAQLLTNCDSAKVNIEVIERFKK